MKTARKGRGLGLVLVALVCLCAESQATPIKYEYGGVITSADTSTGIAPGTRFSGTFTYDPAVTPPPLMIEGMNQYSYGKANYVGAVADGSGITFQVGDRTVLSNPGGVTISVYELEYPGQYGYRDANGPIGPFTKLSITNSNIGDYANGPIVDLGLDNNSRSVFGSLAPPSVLNLTDFPDAKLIVSELTNPGERQLYAGTIDTLQAVPIPEPASLACWGLAVLGVIGMARRRKRTN